MASLLVESFCNNVKTKTEGILTDHSNIKELIQIIIDQRVNNLNAIYSLRANYSFKEKGTDLLTKLYNSKASRDMLESYGYRKTTMDKYNYENFNNIEFVEEIDHIIKQNNVFVETIKLYSKDIEKEYMYHFKDNYVIFTPTISNSPTEYYFDFKDCKVIDFKIDKDYFVFMILEINNKKHFIVSHLGKDFIRYNEDESKLDLESCFNDVIINENISSLEYYCDNEFWFLKDDLSINKITMCKKYYFEDGEYLYFNHQGDLENYKQHFLEERQNNFLNMYNTMNFLGLNDFKINSRKISTRENPLFLDLFKNKYDNTLNGGLNYFNSLPNTLLGKDGEVKSYLKDYHISVSDEYYSINGNFKYENFKKGDYRIEITEETASLFKKIKGVYTLVEKVNIPTYDEFIFCNLYFKFKKFEFPNKPYSFDLTAKDAYVFKQTIDKRNKVFELPNNNQIIENIINDSSSKIKIKHQPYFDGRSIVFENYFDWNSKRFLFGNLMVDISNSSVVELKDNRYYCNTQYDLKDGKLCSRGKGKVVYTLTDSFKFDLINSKGYITKFWIENQNKKIYFKCKNDKIEISDNEEDSDFYCFIPNIKDYIYYDSNSFGNITVDINDSLELTKPYNDSLMITDKFYDIPLFYKTFIETDDLTEIKIFDHTDKEIVKYITKKFKNGYIYYFHAEKDKKYYYNTKDAKYNYFTPLDSYQNIDFDYYFDDTCYITLNESTTFNTITLKSHKNIIENFDLELFIYNENDETTNKITFNTKDLNTKFELDLNVSKFYLKVNHPNYKADDFYITEDSNKSLIIDGNITFFKEDRNSIVYISNKNQEIDFDFIDFSSLQINTYYDLSYNGKLIKSNKRGLLIIFSMNPNEIALLPCNNLSDYIESPMFKVISLGSDENSFYTRNFKDPGNNYSYNSISPKNIANYSSNKFTMSKKTGVLNE